MTCTSTGAGSSTSTTSPEASRRSWLPTQENLAETENADIETRPFLEGVIQVLVIDHPDRVEFVSAELMERLGGWDTASALASANIRAHTIDAPAERLGSVEAWAVLDAIVDDSFYAASKALHAREFVEASAGRPIGEGRFYFCIPNRHQFASCLLQDSNAASSLPPMAEVPSHSALAPRTATRAVGPWSFARRSHRVSGRVPAGPTRRGQARVTVVLTGVGFWTMSSTGQWASTAWRSSS